MVYGKQRWNKAYYGLVKGENFLANFFLLIIRLYWGWLLMINGFGKWMHLNDIASYFSSLNIPFAPFFAPLVATVEFIGGISLILGLFARILTIPLVINFIVALVTAHIAATSQLFTQPDLTTKQEPFLYLFVSLIVLCFGSGFISIDYWIEKKVYGKGLVA